METFELPSLGFKHVIVVDRMALCIRSPGIATDIPWERLRGVAVTVGRGFYNRSAHLLIGYDGPNAPGRSILLPLMDRMAPEIRGLSAALRGRDRRLWHGESTLIAARAAMGLSNRRFGVAVAVSVALACLLAVLTVVLAATTRGSARDVSDGPLLANSRV